ncbi:hypothetical protein Tco_1041593 [Tanacetum coccineum]|uniref:Reverse transcriptase domain-containing protein n=1 Tax=Tanacetum coccineum TaxID=301880 RepID=A0ABQ5GHL6_9ASTR
MVRRRIQTYEWLNGFLIRKRGDEECVVERILLLICAMGGVKSFVSNYQVTINSRGERIRECYIVTILEACGLCLNVINQLRKEMLIMLGSILVQGIQEVIRTCVKGKSVYGSRIKRYFTWTPSLNFKEHDYSSEDESVQGVGSKENKYNTYEKEEGEFNNSEDEEVAETDFMEKSSQSGNTVYKEAVEENLEPSPSFVTPRVIRQWDLCEFNGNYKGGSVLEVLDARRFVVGREMEDMDFVQKAKVRWAIEGDENSKYFHGIINKKRSNLAIRGVFVDDQEEQRKALFLKMILLKAYARFRLGLLADVLGLLDSVRCCTWIRGDPLSPFLFILVMEALHLSVCKAVDEDVFKGIQLQGSLALSHLFYADDAFFMGEWLLHSLWKTSSLSWGYGWGMVPKGVLKVMESIRSNFFKGASMLEKKISWIAWDKVLASKKKGGLGVSSYFALNRALLLKWVWRFVSQDDSLWFRVIQAVHGDKIDSHSVRKVSIWSSILKEVQVLKSSGFDFLSYCSKRIGDGQSTSFWKETWIGDIPLCELCPRLFALDSAPNICVAAKMAGPLDTSFRRSVRGGVEQQEFSDLSSFLNSVVLSTYNDRWYFSLSSSGGFASCLPLVGDRFPALRSFLSMGRVVSSISLPGSVKVCWKESSTLLGGLFGDFGIVLLLMLISRLDRSFLRILSSSSSFDVIVGVVEVL